MRALVIEDFVAEYTLVKYFEYQLSQRLHLKILEGASNEGEQCLGLHLVVINFLVDVSVEKTKRLFKFLISFGFRWLLKVCQCLKYRDIEIFFNEKHRGFVNILEEMTGLGLANCIIKFLICKLHFNL